MLIFARAEDAAPLPFPLKVEGEQVKGEGVVYYQVIVPMDRGGSAIGAMNKDSAIYDLGSAPPPDPVVQPFQGQPRPQQRPPNLNRPQRQQTPR
jgi:hypothetical protein